MVTVIKGNLFASDRQTLVNTINCVGVMGAGIALEFKLRYPEMFRRYEVLCRDSRMEIGKLWLYKPEGRCQRALGAQLSDQETLAVSVA